MVVKYGRKSTKSIYKIYVRPEGEDRIVPTSIWYKRRKAAETFANLETSAGMGETYYVKRARRGWHGERRRHSLARRRRR